MDGTPLLSQVWWLVPPAKKNSIYLSQNFLARKVFVRILPEILPNTGGTSMYGKLLCLVLWDIIPEDKGGR